MNIIRLLHLRLESKMNKSRIIPLFLVFFTLLISCSNENNGATTQTAIVASETPTTTTEDNYSQARETMVRTTIQARGVKDPDVLRAMRTVPRHKFVPEEYIDYAYNDHPLPIGYGQTISQPFIVALMTELLQLKEGAKVLEIGSGSGYQAAILEELGYVEVYSIEIIPELAERAADTLEKTGYSSVTLKQGDGYYGWEEYAPFDAIIVTAAPDHLPLSLTQQLKDNGILVIPIGPPGGYQTLWQFHKQGNELVAYNQGGVSFVPFTGGGVETKP